MPETRMSESAVATLRFELRGLRPKNKESRLAAYRELAEAGIMEPVADDYRLTEWGREHGQEIVEREYDRIERERYESPNPSGLSDAAKSLLRRIAGGEQVEVTDANRPLFRELATARFVGLGHSFRNGRESIYRWTYWGWERREEWLGEGSFDRKIV